MAAVDGAADGLGVTAEWRLTRRGRWGILGVLGSAANGSRRCCSIGVPIAGNPGHCLAAVTPGFSAISFGGSETMAVSQERKPKIRAVRRAKWRCENCGERYSPRGHDRENWWGLEVHHQDRQRGHNHPHNLRVLCNPCHVAMHAGGRYRSFPVFSKYHGKNGELPIIWDRGSMRWAINRKCRQRDNIRLRAMERRLVCRSA